MPESPEEIYARVVATVGATGRLPMPDIADWAMFPWELVDGALAPKVVQPPLEFEAPRSGVGGDDCALCEGTTGAVRIWQSEAFHVTRPSEPGGSPMVLFLNANEHLDFPELNDEQAAEFGRLSVWLTRIVEALPHIGRVHLNRWGDGSEHMHTWFIARPERLPGIIGATAWEWTATLPPVDRDTWLADCAAVAHRLANHEGRSLV